MIKRVEIIEIDSQSEINKVITEAIENIKAPEYVKDIDLFYVGSPWAFLLKIGERDHHTGG